jgi:hypothetical protein
VGRNDPCPCGSGKKYKKCCALQPPDKPAEGFRFEPGSYGGEGGFFPSLRCIKEAGGSSSLHFVLVNPLSVHEDADDASEKARGDLEGAFSAGAGDPHRVASHLADAGYCMIDDPHVAVG